MMRRFGNCETFDEGCLVAASAFMYEKSYFAVLIVE